MRIIILAMLVLLGGCFDDTTELKATMKQIRENTTTYIEPMPAVKPFNHFAYSAQELRSPFILPKPEVLQQNVQQMAGCLSPDPRRNKQPLEQYPLNDLSMRGTIGDADILWALIEATDATLHRIKIGSYLGLYDGQVTEVTDQHVKVLELTPDGAGCWVESETVMKLVQSQLKL
ncbi:MAG: pilus assembly protein PilP [Colwellia sp.]